MKKLILVDSLNSKQFVNYIKACEEFSASYQQVKFDKKVGKEYTIDTAKEFEKLKKCINLNLKKLAEIVGSRWN